MQLAWSPIWIIGPVVAIVLALLRRIAPAVDHRAEHNYSDHQIPEQLPTGVIGGAMWAIALVLASTFFLFRSANHALVGLDGPAVFTQYAPQVYWCFFPGFAALSIPWPLTVWYLRYRGRWEEADRIEDDSSSKKHINMYLALKWSAIGVAGPIGIFTLLAIPIHLTVTNSEFIVGQYARLHAEHFPFSQARRLTIVDGYLLRDGTLQQSKDAIIDFADGRRLHGNAVGDGGTNIPDDLLQLIVQKTGLAPQYARTEKEIPPLQ